MFQIFSVFVENNLKHDLKKHKSKLVYSFLIGLIIGSLPTINKMKENFGVQKLIQEQRQIQNQNKEKIKKINKLIYDFSIEKLTVLWVRLGGDHDPLKTIANRLGKNCFIFG